MWTKHEGYHFNRVWCIRRIILKSAQLKHLSHHKTQDSLAPPVLSRIYSEFVDGFVLDYMHNACIGVTKRLLSRLLTCSTKDKKVHLNTQMKGIFAEKLKIIQKFIPSDFQRKIEGSLDTILRWKATQYRLFLL